MAEVVIDGCGGLPGARYTTMINLVLSSLLLRLLVPVEIRALVCDALILLYLVHSRQHHSHGFHSPPVHHPTTLSKDTGLDQWKYVIAESILPAHGGASAG